jgi:WD40 repeat protein
MAMVDRAPLRERRWLLLARAHYQAGRQSDALGTLRRFRDVLADELGLDAGAEAGALEEAILRQDPSLAVVPDVVEPDSVCPYPGLRAYGVEDSAAFFGRDVDVSACLRRLRDSSVVAVVGPSGTGKSSVVRAGIGAAMLRDGRRVAALTPGQHPMSSMAGVTTGPRTVLLVDQCEEVFSLCRDPDERTAFLAALTAWATSGQLIVSMRADHLAGLAEHPTFARVVERGLYLLGGMAEPALREAIEGPARRSGLIVEPGLVDLLVNELEGQPGALPLLSHTLRETWRRREGRTLTLASYQASGGIRGAVAKSAETVYATGDEAHREALRDLMLRLVTVGEDEVPLRTRLPRRAVVHDPAHDAVLDRLIAARLVTIDGDVVQLAHEALARAWPRLRGWLEDDVDGQRIRQHLTVAAEAWVALGRPESELYRGVRLAAAISWRRTSSQSLPQAEADFLDAAERVADAERLAVDSRVRHQARVNRSLQGLLGATAVLLVAALIAGGLAVRQAKNAEQAESAAVHSSRLADRAVTTADSRRLGARALTTEDISLSLLLAVEGARADDSDESRANLVAAIVRRPALVLTGTHLPRHLGSLAGNGARGVMATSDGRNRVVFLTRALEGIGSRQMGVPHPGGHFVQVEFNPAGTALAAAPEEPEPDGRRVGVTLLDTYTQQPIGQQPTAVGLGPAGATDITWSADGRHVAAAYGRPGASSLALVWDLGSGSPPARVPLPRGAQGVALARDGSVLYASGPLAAYDVRSGRPLWRTHLHGPHIDLAPSGHLLALPYDDGVRGSDVLLTDTDNGSVVRRLTGHRDQVTDVRFAPDGHTVAAVGADGLLTTWRVARGVEVERVETGPVAGLTYSRFGSHLMTTSAEGEARLWDLRGELRYVTRLVQPRVALDPAAISVPANDGRAVASSWTDRSSTSHLRLMNVDTMSTHSLRLDLPLRVGTWAGNRTRFVGATKNRLTVWNRSGRELGHRPLDGAEIVALAELPTWHRLVGATRDGQLLQFDSRTLAPVAAPLAPGVDVCCLASGPGPHQATVAVRGASGQILVIDLQGRRVLRGETADRPVLSLAVSAVTRTAAVGTADGQLETVDLDSARVRHEPGSRLEPPATWTALSSSAHTAVTTADDGSIRLWDENRAHLMSRLDVPETAPVTATFLAGDNDLLLTTRDGGVYRWDTRPDRALDFACAAAGRSLTRAEWALYLGTRPYRSTCAFARSSYDDSFVRLEVGDVEKVGPPNR